MEKNSLKNEVIRAQNILKEIQMRFTAEYQLNTSILEEIKVYKQKLQCMEDERSQSLAEIEKHLSIIAKTNEELQHRLNNKDSWICDADEDISQVNSVNEQSKEPEEIETGNLANFSNAFALQMNENISNQTGAVPPSTPSNLEKYLQDLYQELCARVQDQQNQANEITKEPAVELEAIKALLDEGEKRLQRLSAKNKGNWTKDEETMLAVAGDQISSSLLSSKPTPDGNQEMMENTNYIPPFQDGWMATKTSTPTPNLENDSFSLVKEAVNDTCKVPLTNSTVPEESKKIQTPRPVGPIQAATSPANRSDTTAFLESRSLGKGKDYFEEMFDKNKDLLVLGQGYRVGRNHVSKAPTPPIFNEYNATTSSAIGNLCILEINDEGKFVRLYNADQKDAEIGCYMIKQNVGGHPVIVFRFPPRTKFPRNSIITVWAAECDNDVFHDPPSNYVWDAQVKWGVGPEFTTILCKPNGQAIAWTNAAHKFNPQLSPQIPITPVHIRTMQRTAIDSPIETKPSYRNEIALDLRNSSHACDKNLVFLKREKQNTISNPVQCVKHPHGLAPGNLVHPCAVNERDLKWLSPASTPTPRLKKSSRKRFSKRCSSK